MNNPRNLPYVTSLRQDGPQSDGQAEIHRFIASPAGVLVHYTDNQLRGIVPPQGFEDYLVAWPESAAAIAELRRARAKIETMAARIIARAQESARRHKWLCRFPNGPRKNAPKLALRGVFFFRSIAWSGAHPRSDEGSGGCVLGDTALMVSHGITSFHGCQRPV